MLRSFLDPFTPKIVQLPTNIFVKPSLCNITLQMLPFFILFIFSYIVFSDEYEIMRYKNIDNTAACSTCGLFDLWCDLPQSIDGAIESQ